MKKFFMVGIFATLLSIFLTNSVFAATGAMESMARSYQMQGTTDFYYSNQWLVSSVQFMISWLSIIALLVYYAGWLCSMVTLSNKELFYLIDTIKKEGQESGESQGFSAITSVLKTFKNGSKDGVNGGLDNVFLFILALSLNFKAYSFYKNVEAGSDGTDSKSKFSYNDTMLSFILKTLVPSISITFVTSVAISGTLLACWFTIGDVFIVRAERFAQTNLSAKVDSLIGDSAGYQFSLGANGTRGGDLAEKVAQRLYVNIVAQFPSATAAQLQAIGLAVENEISTLMLGSNPVNYYGTLQALVRNTTVDTQKPNIIVTNEEQAALVKLKNFSVNSNESNFNNTQIVIPFSKILTAAGVAPDPANRSYQKNLYAHILLSYNNGTAGTMLSDAPQ